jgi:uncharacterized OsmC-like protein
MKVLLNYNEKLHFTASVRQFEDIQIDEPESFHGSDLGPSAVEYFLIGTGGCIGSTFVYCLQKNKVLIEKLEIIVNGTLKHEGSKKRLRLVKIDVELLTKIKQGSSTEKFNFCKKNFHEHCPISHVLTHGIPLNIIISEQ